MDLIWKLLLKTLRFGFGATVWVENGWCLALIVSVSFISNLKIKPQAAFTSETNLHPFIFGQNGLFVVAHRTILDFNEMLVFQLAYAPSVVDNEEWEREREELNLWHIILCIVEIWMVLLALKRALQSKWVCHMCTLKFI